MEFLIELRNFIGDDGIIVLTLIGISIALYRLFTNGVKRNLELSND